MKLTLLAVCLLLASCGGKSSATRVRVSTLGTGIQVCCMPFVLTQELGFFRDEGLDVVMESFPSGAKATQALIGGSADIAVINYVHNVQVAAEGQRVRAFFVLSQRATNVLIVAPQAASRIQRVEDLKGAVIGVTSPGAASHLWLNYEMNAHGIKASEFSVVGIGTGAPALAAIESGRIDAASLVGGDHFAILKRHPDLRVLVDASTPEGLRESYGSDAYASGVVTAKQEWLDSNPGTARKLARALRRTMSWMAAHKPEEIRDRLPGSYRSEDAEVDVRTLRWGLQGPAPDGRMPKGAPETIKRYLDATVESVRASKIDLTSTWTDEFLPDRI